MVDEKVGQTHEILAPRKHHRKNRDGEQGPFHRAFNHKQRQDEQHQHEGAHIHGAARHRLFTPILPDLLVNRQIVRIGLLHRLFALRQRHRRATLRVRNEQRPRLADAIRPLRDVVAFQAARGLVGRIFLHQLALSAHRFLRILPRMIEVRNIHQNTHGSGSGTHRRGLQHVLPTPGFIPLELAPLSLRRGAGGEALDKERHHHRHDDEQVVICHLHVVRIHLESRENGRHDESPEVFPAIGQHHARNHRRQVGQRPHFPDVAGGDDDEEITRKRPHNRTQHRQFAAEIEGAQQDVEAEQIDEDVPHVFRQPQVVGRDDLREHRRALIRRRRLIRRHSAERRVRPARALARALAELLRLLSGTASGGGIVLIEDAPLDVGGGEIGERNSCKQHHDNHVGQDFFQCIHHIFPKILCKGTKKK